MQYNIGDGGSKMIFQDKTVLITGGTGSLGKTLVRQIMSGKRGEPKKIIIFSRDEDKQNSMKLEWKNMKVATDEVFYHNFEEILDFRIGDVRDYESLSKAVKDSDIVIHAAALKQVPVCEYFPIESIKTNVIGAQNVLQAVKANGEKVEVVLGVSSDKACKPINTYGMCKAIQERLMVQANLDSGHTRFICVRYGNVIASRGSVIPLFKEQIRNGGPVTITVKEMTRFWLTLDTAVAIIFDALHSAQPGDIYVPDTPSANIVDLAEVMIGDRKVGIQFTGIRPGEKLHEILISEEEITRTIKRDDYYVICPMLPELQKENIAKPILAKEFSSADCVMNKSELKSFLQREGHLDF
jgi:FlaA1/EpsC-like NDP-sugar epimerase